MKRTREWKQGGIVFLLALGMVLSSGVLLYWIWREPNIAAVIGAAVLCAGLLCWAGLRLTLRFAPDYTLRRRLNRLCGRENTFILSQYTGSGSLLEDWDWASEADPETLADVSYLSVRLEEQTGPALHFSGRWTYARNLNLEEGSSVLLILSGWSHPTHLMGKITALRHSEDRCELEITLTKALFADRRREFEL